MIIIQFLFIICTQHHRHYYHHHQTNIVAYVNQAFETWLKELPDSNPPSWLGLPLTAESQLQINIAQRILINLSILQDNDDNNSGNVIMTTSSSSSSSLTKTINSSGNDNNDHQQHQQIIVELQGTLQLVENWMSNLPSLSSLPQLIVAIDNKDKGQLTMNSSSASSSSSLSPLQRWLQREFSRGYHALETILNDLTMIR